MRTLRIMLFSDLQTLEDEGIMFFQNVGNHHAVMWHHIPEGTSPQPHCCENLKNGTGHVLAILMSHHHVLHISRNTERKFYKM
jgi:hypothetical protein